MLWYIFQLSFPFLFAVLLSSFICLQKNSFYLIFVILMQSVPVQPMSLISSCFGSGCFWEVPFCSVQRITIEQIRNDEWFKKCYVPVRLLEYEDVNLDDLNAVFDDCEVGKAFKSYIFFPYISTLIEILTCILFYWCYKNLFC